MTDWLDAVFCILFWLGWFWLAFGTVSNVYANYWMQPDEWTEPSTQSKHTAYVGKSHLEYAVWAASRAWGAFFINFEADYYCYIWSCWFASEARLMLDAAWLSDYVRPEAIAKTRRDAHWMIKSSKNLFNKLYKTAIIFGALLGQVNKHLLNRYPDASLQKRWHWVHSLFHPVVIVLSAW